MKILIVHPKYEINFIMLFFPILLPIKLSILPLYLNFCIGFILCFIASFLYCFTNSYRSSNECNSNSFRSFLLLKAISKINGKLLTCAPIARKSTNYRYRDSWKSDNYNRKSNKEKKQINYTKNKAKKIKSNNCKGAIKKNLMIR